jgi:purine-cytosine permease-like protein
VYIAGGALAFALLSSAELQDGVPTMIMIGVTVAWFGGIALLAVALIYCVGFFIVRTISRSRVAPPDDEGQENG